MQRRVAILIADGFTDSGLSIALDVLRTANVLSERAGKPSPFQIEVASAHGGRVRAASGMVLESTRSVRQLRADVVIVPGIWVTGPEQMESIFERNDVERLVRAIAAAHARGAIMAGSCGGTFLLAEAGLLDGHEATTTWWMADYLKQRRPRVKVIVESAMIVAGRVITAGAAFAQADVALHIVGHFAGPSIARQCANVLLLDTHASQAPYMARQHLRANDPVVRQAERWVRAHIAEPLEIAKLAKHVGTSPRTLARRLNATVGLSPIAFVQRVRVESAVLMLQTSKHSLEEISARVGYADASTLSRLVRRETKVSPQEFRRARAAPQSRA